VIRFDERERRNCLRIRLDKDATTPKGGTAEKSKEIKEKNEETHEI